MTTQTDRPVQRPPQAAFDNGTTTGGSAPTLSPTDVAETSLVAAPTLTPPSATATQGGTGDDQGVTATWRNGVRITALWSVEEARNAFVHIDGVGWRKIHNARDGAFAALLTLAGQARQTNRTVNLREEADGMIYEIYLW